MIVVMAMRFRNVLWPRGARDRGLGWVYFVRAGCFVKIGASYGGLAGRVAAIQTGNPYDVRLWLAIPMDGWQSANALEFSLHERFSHYHCRGEWFWLSTEIVNFVRVQRRQHRANEAAA